MVLPGHEGDGHHGRFGDLALGTVLDVARTWVATRHWVRRVASNPAQIQALDAQRIADAEDQPDVGQAADVVEHDADRRPRQLSEYIWLRLAGDQLGRRQRWPLGRR